MATAGSIYVNILARTENFERGMGRSSSALSAFAARAKALGPAIVAGLSGAAVAKAASYYIRTMRDMEKATEGLTGSQLTRLREFNAEVTRLTSSVASGRNKIMIDIAPAATSAVKMLNDVFVLATGEGRISNAAGSSTQGAKRPYQLWLERKGGMGYPTGQFGPPPESPLAPARPGFAAQQTLQSQTGFANRVFGGIGGRLAQGPLAMARGTAGNAAGMLSGFDPLGSLDSMMMQMRGQALMQPFGVPPRAAAAGGRNQASIDELQSRLDSAPGEGSSRRRPLLNEALREGSGGAELAIARSRQQEKQMELEKKQEEHLKAIRTVIEKANQMPAATSLPVYDIGSVA